MNYLNHLATWVSPVVAKVNVVLGRKDGGKSKGLQEMIPLWKSIGHVVVDVNLKSKVQNVSAAMIMPIVAQQLDQEFSMLAPQDYKCVYQYIHNIFPDAKQLPFESRLSLKIIFIVIAIATVCVVSQRDYFCYAGLHLQTNNELWLTKTKYDLMIEKYL